MVFEIKKRGNFYENASEIQDVLPLLPEPPAA
jgi:hypothetical protein